MTVKSPFGGSYKWMGPSLNWMTRGMDASLRKLIRALVTQDPPQIASARATFEDEITEILILSDLTGRMYTLKKADMVPPPSGPAMTDAGPEEPGEEIEIKFGAIPFREAIEDIVSREPRLAKSAAEVADLYSRTHAFALAKSTDLVLTRKIQDVMTTLMEKDMDPSDAGKVIAEMGDWTRAYGETVFRTNAATAFSEGQFQQALDPDVADLIPAFEYDAVLDSNTRPNHRAANGLVAGTRDSIWRVFTPPIGYRCRCSINFVDRYTLKERGLLDKSGRVIRYTPPNFAHAYPDPGFGQRQSAYRR